MEQRIVLKLAYEGTAYHGFQKQEGLSTIAGTVEEQLRSLFPWKMENFIGASRTDQGVHALCNLLSFDPEGEVSGEQILRALNSYLPEDIRVLEAYSVQQNFHPRFTPHRKAYRYSICRSKVENPLCRRTAYHYTFPLDCGKISEGMELLKGEHDFRSFANPKAQSLLQGGSSVREIYRFSMEEEGDYLHFSVEGNGFLYHMIRILAGTLLELGRGRISLSQLEEILEKKDRTLAGPTAPAKGLCLMNLDYGDFQSFLL